MTAAATMASVDEDEADEADKGDKSDSTDVVGVPAPIEVKSTLTLTSEDATGFDKDGDASQDTLKESVAVSVINKAPDDDLQAPGESASTGVKKGDRLQRIAERLEILAGDSEWLPGSDDCLANLEALTAEIEAKGHPPDNNLPKVPETKDSSTDVVKVPTASQIVTKSTLTLTAEDAQGERRVVR